MSILIQIKLYFKNFKLCDLTFALMSSSITWTMEEKNHKQHDKFKSQVKHRYQCKSTSWYQFFKTNASAIWKN